MPMQAQIRVPNFKTILKIMESFGEEAVLQFTPEGMSVSMVDIQRVRMVQLHIHADGFEEYECDCDYELGVVLIRMKDIVKTLVVKDELRLEIVDGNPIRFSLLANGMERGIKLLNLRTLARAPDWPIFSFTYSATVPAIEARSFVKAASESLNFDVVTEGSSMTWRIDNELEPLEWTPTESLVKANEHAVTTYGVEEVKAAICGTSREKLSIRGGTDIPIEFSWEPYDGVSVSSLVAHCTGGNPA